MTEVEIGLRLIVLLLMVGVCRNIIGPALKRADTWINDVIQEFNGDTYTDRKAGWE